MNERTSLAYEYHRFEEAEQLETERKKPQIQTVKKSKVLKKQTGVLRAACCMSVIVLTLSTLIYTRVVQTELSADYNTAITELNSIKSENARLQVQLEEELSADNIEAIARQQLNMQEIDNSKVEYVDFNSDPKAEVLKKQSVFDEILSWLRSLTE